MQNILERMNQQLTHIFQLKLMEYFPEATHHQQLHLGFKFSMSGKFCCDPKEETFHYLRFMSARGRVLWWAQALLWINSAARTTHSEGCSHLYFVPSIYSKVAPKLLLPQRLIVHSPLCHTPSLKCWKLPSIVWGSKTSEAEIAYTAALIN